MRLIDADALKMDLTRFYDGEVVAKRLIDEQPTIIPAEPPKEETHNTDPRTEQERQDTAPTTHTNSEQPEIIRCKDCVHCKPFNDVWYQPKMDTLVCVHIGGMDVEATDYCSWAERKCDE